MRLMKCGMFRLDVEGQNHETHRELQLKVKHSILKCKDDPKDKGHNRIPRDNNKQKVREVVHRDREGEYREGIEVSRDDVHRVDNKDKIR